MRWLTLPLLAGCVETRVIAALPRECEPDDVSSWPTVDPRDGVSPVGRLTPFDEAEDWAGPASTTYGKTPEIVTAADLTGFDVLLQDYGGGASARLVRIERDPSGYKVTQILELDTLDRIMGLAHDSEGFRYVASGVAEAQEYSDTPAVGEYREDIVHIDKIAPDGEVVYTVDLDKAREAAFPGCELVVSPMVAATSRLAWGGGKLELLHGINTDIDPSIARRHQKALATVLDAATGDVLRPASIWVSHSFDQRLIYDGTGFIELHLGDAYPRQIVMARTEPDSLPVQLLHVKGTTGDNNTYSRLGSVAVIPPAEDPDYGYLGVFSTESTEDLAGGGPKNVGLVRVRRAFEATVPDEHLDPAMPDTLVATVDGAEKTNHLWWLTDYTVEGREQAERSRVVNVGCDRYLVLWERWVDNAFDGTQGLVVDATGAVIVPTTRVTDTHLPLGDDVVAFDNSAAWVSASKNGTLYVNRVHADLSFERVTIE